MQASVEGEPEVMDLRKIVGNTVWRETADIATSDVGRDIYLSDGEMDIRDDMVREIGLIVSRSTLIAPVKRALGKLLTPKNED